MTWHADMPSCYCDAILNGDAAELGRDLPDGSVDLILTDPPYPQEFSSVWSTLAGLARALRPGGALVTLCGCYQVDFVMDALRAGGLSWYWMGWLHANGTMLRLQGRKILGGGKPILWFTKGKPAPREVYVWDTITSETADKRFHKWQQNERWAREYIEKLTEPGGIVLDPFVGSGTVPVVCKELRRGHIGFEIDHRTAARARERLRSGRLPLPFEEPPRSIALPLEAAA